MKKGAKMIITGATIFVIGLIVFIVFCGLNNWEFNPDYEMKTFVSEGKITKLDINLYAGSIETAYSDDGKISVEYPENDNFTATCELKDGVLTVSNGKKHWYNFNWWFGTIPKITVRIPKDAVYDLNLYLNAGTVDLEKYDYGKVYLKLNAGTVEMDETTCTDFYCYINAGKAEVDGLTCPKTFVQLNAGEFVADDLVCPDIEAKINAGSINLDIIGVKSEYSVFVDKNAGSCNLSNTKGTTDKEIRAKINAGSLSCNFSN